MFIGLFGLSPVQRRRYPKSLALGKKVALFWRFWPNSKVFILRFAKIAF